MRMNATTLRAYPPHILKLLNNKFVTLTNVQLLLAKNWVPNQMQQISVSCKLPICGVQCTPYTHCTTNSLACEYHDTTSTLSWDHKNLPQVAQPTMMTRIWNLSHKFKIIPTFRTCNNADTSSKMMVISQPNG